MPGTNRSDLRIERYQKCGKEKNLFRHDSPIVAVPLVGGAGHRLRGLPALNSPTQAAKGDRPRHRNLPADPGTFPMWTRRIHHQQ